MIFAIIHFIFQPKAQVMRCRLLALLSYRSPVTPTVFCEGAALPAPKFWVHQLLVWGVWGGFGQRAILVCLGLLF